MADKILLPGTEMEVIEKYPLSRRLDHPDFGDVCKTTFAVGVITDFKMALKSECDPLLNYPGKFSGNDQVDPFRVVSLVKVEIEGQEESGWLPLFYHLKAQMWDDTDMVVSDDVGDESTVNPGVLAQDFNTEGGYFEKAWMSFCIGDEVTVMLKEGLPVAVVGHADGVPRVGEAVFKLNISKITGLTLGAEAPRYIQINEMKLNPDGETGPDGLNLQLVQEVVPICDKESNIYSVPYSAYIYSYYTMWAFAVGPKLIVVTQWVNNTVPGGYGSPVNRIYIALATKENIETAQAIADSITVVPYVYHDYFQGVSGFYKQSDILVYGTTGNLNTVWYTYPTPPKYNKFNSIYTHPHTKAELQAANMWPVGAS